MSTLAGLLFSLSGVPSLPGAACRGLAPTFDDPDGNEPAPDVEHRRTVALALCGQCSALTRCRQWLESLPANQRPSGVVAGTVVESPTTRKVPA